MWGHGILYKKEGGVKFSGVMRNDKIHRSDETGHWHLTLWVGGWYLVHKSVFSILFLMKDRLTCLWPSLYISHLETPSFIHTWLLHLLYNAMSNLLIRVWNQNSCWLVVFIFLLRPSNYKFTDDGERGEDDELVWWQSLWAPGCRGPLQEPLSASTGAGPGLQVHEDSARPVRRTEVKRRMGETGALHDGSATKTFQGKSEVKTGVFIESGTIINLELINFSFKSDKSLEELSISASNIMLSLKADQDSFDKRYELQVIITARVFISAIMYTYTGASVPSSGV